jgi:hypothetical protein
MKRRPTLPRRAGEALVRCVAAWLEPTRQRDWGRAMRAEVVANAVSGAAGSVMLAGNAVNTSL